MSSPCNWELVSSKIFYKKTSSMIMDLLTQPLGGTLFHNMVEVLPGRPRYLSKRGERIICHIRAPTRELSQSYLRWQCCLAQIIRFHERSTGRLVHALQEHARNDRLA